MSLKDYADMMVGARVVVEDDAGDIFTGVLRRFSTVDQLEVELVFAQKVPSASESSNYIYSERDGVETFKIKATRMGGDKTRNLHERAFRTDSKIASSKNLNGESDHPDVSDTELVLQEWEDDGCGEYGGIECGNDAIDELDSMGGWSVTDMFQANKDKCVGNGTVFDESEFSNVGIGEHSKEVLEKAQALAQQISMNPSSRHNAQLENDDEERDLDAATKFDANEKSQRGGGKSNGEYKQQRQVMDKVSISSSKMLENKKEGKYDRKMSTSEKRIHSQKVMTTESNEVRKMGNKKFEKEKKVVLDLSPPPEPSPPQNIKPPTPLQYRKNSGGGRASVDRAVSSQSSEQGDKGERKFKLDLNAPSFVPSSKPSTKCAESTTIVNTNINNPVSSAPTPMMSNNSLVVYNNGTTTSTNNLATIATNFGNNFMANQVTTFVPVPTATLQQFQYAQLQHQPPIAQTQAQLTHQPMPPNHTLSRSPSVQLQQQHVQQVNIPATGHQAQQQHVFQQQQQQVAGFYAATGTDATNLSAYVLNWGAAANNFGNNVITNQVATFVPIPAATLQQFQYAQLQHVQPPIPHQPPPTHTLSRSSSVQPQQQHVQQTNMQVATVHQSQQQHGFQQQQMTSFYAATAAATNLSAYAQPLIQQSPYQPYFIAQNNPAVPPHVTVPPPPTPMTHSIAYDSTHQIPPPGVFVGVPTQHGLNGNMYGGATVGHSQQQTFQQPH
ncbi:hypothetical protein ACQ4LE_010303 [Meloidogyne hapla]